MGSLYIKDFPEELHQEVKSRAALEGITMRELIVRALSHYLKGPITLDVKEVIVKRRESEDNQRGGE
jgi:plasmid stability protein